MALPGRHLPNFHDWSNIIDTTTDDHWAGYINNSGQPDDAYVLVRRDDLNNLRAWFNDGHAVDYAYYASLKLAARAVVDNAIDPDDVDRDTGLRVSGPADNTLRGLQSDDAILWRLLGAWFEPNISYQDANQAANDLRDAIVARYGT